MNDIEIWISAPLKKNTSRLIDLQAKAGISSKDIVFELASTLGGTARSWGTVYSGYRTGLRKISNRAIPILSKMLGVPLKELLAINDVKLKTKCSFSIPANTSVNSVIEKFRGKPATVTDLVLGLHELSSEIETQKMRRILKG